MTGGMGRSQKSRNGPAVSGLPHGFQDRAVRFLKAATSHPSIIAIIAAAVGSLALVRPSQFLERLF